MPMPSLLSSAIKTFSNNNGIIIPSEISAARAVLSGTVSRVVVKVYTLHLIEINCHFHLCTCVARFWTNNENDVLFINPLANHIYMYLITFLPVSRFIKKGDILFTWGGRESHGQLLLFHQESTRLILWFTSQFPTQIKQANSIDFQCNCWTKHKFMFYIVLLYSRTRNIQNQQE